MRMHPDELGGPGAKKRERVLTEDEELDAEEELVYHLTSAQQHVEEAKAMLDDSKNGAKRSIWYRAVLSTAHNVLTSLLVRELRS